MKFSFYQNIKDTNKTDISLDEYIDLIKNGKYQDVVLTARAIKKEPPQVWYINHGAEWKVIF